MRSIASSEARRGFNHLCKFLKLVGLCSVLAAFLVADVGPFRVAGQRPADDAQHFVALHGFCAGVRCAAKSKPHHRESAHRLSQLTQLANDSQRLTQRSLAMRQPVRLVQHATVSGYQAFYVKGCGASGL